MDPRAARTHSQETGLFFIRPGVLERLKKGDFVAERKSHTGPLRLATGGERRNTVSPLAVVKRCVKYDFRVFENRRKIVIHVADALNNPDTKVLMLSGEQGLGKTSLLRAVVELMGGGNEQVLWFDAHRHSGSEELISFLIEFIRYVCLSIDTPHQPLPSDPLEALQQLLMQSKGIPLLLVVDNLEHMVDTTFHLRFQPLKEILNFLLGFANIKMVLVGESLPYSDLATARNAVVHLDLPGLEAKNVAAVLRKEPFSSHPQEIWQPLDPLLHNPWMLRLLGMLLKRTPLADERQQLLESLLAAVSVSSGTDAKKALIQQLMTLLYQQLTPQEKAVGNILCLIRHPVDTDTLEVLLRYCYPNHFLGATYTEPGAFAAWLDRSLLRFAMKRTFPPQRVLQQVRQSQQTEAILSTAGMFHAWYELYASCQKTIARLQPDKRNRAFHEKLQGYYLRERNQQPEERLTQLSAKQLLEEAKYHGQAARISTSALSTFKEPLMRELSDSERVSSLEEPMKDAFSFSFESFEEEDTERSEHPVIPDRLDAWERVPSDTNTLETLPKTSFPPPPATALQTPVTAFPSAGLPVLSPGKSLFDALQAYHAAEFERVVQLLAGLELETAFNATSDRYQAAALLGLASKELYQHNQAIAALLKATHLAETLSSRLFYTAQTVHFQPESLYTALGDIYTYRKQYPDALEMYQKAQVALSTRKGFDAPPSDERLSELLFKLAGTYANVRGNTSDSGNLASNLIQAIRYYQQAFALDKRLGNLLACAASLSNLGTLYMDANRFPKAIRCLKGAIAYDRKANHPAGMFQSILQLSLVFYQYGQAAKAKDVALQALALAIQEDQAAWKTQAYLRLGEFAQDQQRYPEALDWFQSAWDNRPENLSTESMTQIQQKLEEIKRALQ